MTARSAREEYWIEAIGAASEECGAVLTAEQIEHIADTVRLSHENFGMAFGDDVASVNLNAAREREVTQLKAEVRRERAKIKCSACNGRGRLSIFNGTLVSTEECWGCNGVGRVDP